MSLARRILAPLAALLAAGGLFALASLTDRKRAYTIRDAALSTLPDRGTVLTLGDPLWDIILGGRRDDYLGGPAWGYYSTWAGTNPDGSKRKGGTTCGAVAAYWTALAGWPADMVNRLPTDVAPGGGFTPGAHISKIHDGASCRGWLISNPPPADVRAGDYWCLVKEGATYDGKPASGEHVEIVIDISAPNAAGDRTVRCAAGGQECGGNQCAHWVTRTLLADGTVRSADGSIRRLAWIVRKP